MERIKNKIVELAKEVNEMFPKDPEGNRIKYAKFRGMVEMYEMLTMEDINYIRFRDRNDNTYIIAKILFVSHEITL